MVFVCMLLRAGYDLPAQIQTEAEEMSHPVFDELWHIRGRDGTAEEMRLLLQGGKVAHSFRKEWTNMSAW